MTKDQYLAQPFKYDGNGKPLPISDIWGDLTRAQRREIERELKKGKNPDITRYL